MPINLEDFRKSLTYEAVAPITKIWEDLNEIATLDRTAETKQERFLTMMICFISGAILSIILSFMIGGLGLLLVFGFSIAAIYAGVIWSRYERLDVPNQRYELLRKVLPMLERDMDANADVSVCLVLSPSTQKNKVTQTVNHPTLSGFQIKYYKDEWLKIQGQFLDKTIFILTTTELNQTTFSSKFLITNRAKQKPRAKGLNISLALTLPKRQYGTVKILQSQIRKVIKLPENIQIKQVKLTNKDMDLTVNVPSTIAGDRELVYKTITMMFLSLYQVLNLAKLPSKK